MGVQNIDVYANVNILDVISTGELDPEVAYYRHGTGVVGERSFGVFLLNSGCACAKRVPRIWLQLISHKTPKNRRLYLERQKPLIQFRNRIVSFPAICVELVELLLINAAQLRLGLGATAVLAVLSQLKICRDISQLHADTLGKQGSPQPDPVIFRIVPGRAGSTRRYQASGFIVPERT